MWRSNSKAWVTRQFLLSGFMKCLLQMQRNPVGKTIATQGTPFFMILFIFRERGRERKREEEKQDVRPIGCLSHVPWPGDKRLLGCLSCVPWLGTKLVTFCLAGWHPTNWATEVWAQGTFYNGQGSCPTSRLGGWAGRGVLLHHC